MNKLREEFNKTTTPKFSWDKAVTIKNECFGHGHYRNVEVANMEYVRWLENKILSIKGE